MTQSTSFNTVLPTITYDDLEQVLPLEAKREIQWENNKIKWFLSTYYGWDFQGREGTIIAVAGVSLMLIALVFGLLHQRFLPPGISPLSGHIVVVAYATIGGDMIIGGMIHICYCKFFKSMLVEVITQRTVFQSVIKRLVVPLLNEGEVIAFEVIAFEDDSKEKIDIYSLRESHSFKQPIDLSNPFFQGKTFPTLDNLKVRISQTSGAVLA